MLFDSQDGLSETSWQPAADIYRMQDGWLVKFDLAGVRPEDVSVSLSGRRLVVRGTRRDWCTKQGCRHYSMEISYSHFERAIELPGEVGVARLHSEQRDGMLLVRIEMEVSGK